MPFEAQAHDIQLTLNTSSEMVIVRSTSTSCQLLHLLTHFVKTLKADYGLVGFLSLTRISFPIQAAVKSPLKKNLPSHDILSCYLHQVHFGFSLSLLDATS